MSSRLLTGRERTTVILVVGAFFICATMGVRQSFGLFMSPYATELGIGRDSFSLAIALQNIVWGLASPLFGALADRRGPVMATLLGGVFYTIGLLLMAAAGSGGGLMLAQIMVGMGMAGAGFSVILGTVGKVVSPQRRSFALGLVSAAGSFGQFAIVPLAQLGIGWFDARGGVVLLAVIAFLMILCAPLLKLPPHAPRANKSDSGGAVLRAAFSTRSYVLLFFGFFVCGFQVVFIATHLPSYIKDAGLPVATAVAALSLIGLFNIFGTLFCGWVGDKMPKKDALSIFYLLRSLVILLFVLLPISSTSVVVFGAFIGFLWLGTVPLTSGLVAVFFGTKHMSMLYGGIFFSHQIGSFLGAWLGGLLYEWTGDYNVVWFLSIFLGVVAAALHYPITEAPDIRFRRQFSEQT